jgi:hypothetical protein
VPTAQRSPGDLEDARGSLIGSRRNIYHHRMEGVIGKGQLATRRCSHPERLCRRASERENDSPQALGLGTAEPESHRRWPPQYGLVMSRLGHPLAGMQREGGLAGVDQPPQSGRGLVSIPMGPLRAATSLQL